MPNSWLSSRLLVRPPYIYFYYTRVLNYISKTAIPQHFDPFLEYEFDHQFAKLLRFRMSKLKGLQILSVLTLLNL